MSKCCRQRGFTLVELLIALFIFSIMAMLAYGGLRLMIDGSRQLERAANDLASLQRVYLFLQQDLEQAISRPVRDEFGTLESAFTGGSDQLLLALTRSGGEGLIRGTSDLHRVEYHLKAGILERRVWSTLDRVQDSELSRLRLAQELQDITLRFIDYDATQWQQSWPPGGATQSAQLPRAVEITITMEQTGDVTRLFVLGS